MKTIKRVFPFLSKYGCLERNDVALILLMSVAGLFMEAFGLGMLLPVLDYVGADGNIEGLSRDNFIWTYLIEAYDFIGVPITLASLSVTVIVAVSLRQVFDYHYNVRLALIEKTLQVNLKKNTFNDIQDTSLSFFDKMGSGKFMNLMDRQTEAGALVMSGYVRFFRYCMTFFIYSSLMVVTAPLSSGISIIVLAFLLYIVQYYIRETEFLTKKIILFRTEQASFLSEAFRSIRTVKIFSIQEKQKSTFARIAEEYACLSVNLARSTGKIPMVMAPAITIVMMGFLYISVNYLDMTVNTITVFVLILLRLAPVAQAFASLRQSLAQNIINLDTLRTNIDECREYKEVSFETTDALTLNTEIRLEDVSYVYPNSPEPALYDINLTMKIGRVIAITGNSGAGKSTLVDLLASLLRPSKGKIFFDQQDLSCVSPENIRHALSYAAQEPFLFTGSIIENIRLARPDASDEDVIEACKLAYADEFIRNLPDGYDSHLIELGGNLSGGQKQRLALARCFLRKSSLLILDEPTSALDPTSEEKIRKAIRTYVDRNNAIVLLITHRGTTISDADEIICLENGRITDHRCLTGTEATTALAT